MAIPVEKRRFYHLHKQNLLHRAAANDYRKILKNHIALHSTDYTTPYLSLWARVRDFEPRKLLDDLNEKRAVRLRAFRGTVFVVDVESVTETIKASELYMPERLRDAIKQAGKLGIDLDLIEKRVHSMLAGGNALPTKTIKTNLNMPFEEPQFLIARRYLEFKAILTRTGQRYITDPVITYALMEERFPEIDLKSISPEAALDAIMLQYITLFGPVTIDDIAWYFPLSKTKARESLTRIEKHIVYFDLFEKQYIMEKEDHRELLEYQPPPTDRPVITFLPYEDHFPKAYKHRDWYITAETTPMLFHTGKIDWGQLRPSVWLDGEIVGRWEMEWTDKSKSGLSVGITDLTDGRTQSHDIQILIEKTRSDLESFINRKMVPLMKKP